jgi:hypothetical protein
MRTIRASFAAIAALALSPACATDNVAPTSDDAGPDVPGLEDDFARAARDTGVPADLLKAVAYVETQWQMVDGHDEHEGRPGGAGIFGLWGENLTAAAAAVGHDEAKVRVDEKLASRPARRGSPSWRTSTACPATTSRRGARCSPTSPRTRTTMRARRTWSASCASS